MNNNIFPKRLELLDIARGVASISVIIFHWIHFSFNGYRRPKDFNYEVLPFFKILKLFYFEGYNAVNFFFVLSGFIFFWLYNESISNKIISLKEFIIARFSRLYPLHFLTLLIVCILQLLYKNYNVKNLYFTYEYNDIYHFILNLFFINNWGFENGNSFNAPSWSVSIEVIMYIIFFIVSIRKISNLFFCLLVSAFTYIIIALPGFINMPDCFFKMNSIFNGMQNFFNGGIIYFFIRDYVFKFRILQYLIYIICLLSWIGILVNLYTINLSSYFYNLGIIGARFQKIFVSYILFPSTIGSLVLIEIKYLKNNNKKYIINKLSWLGDISYSSYLLHFPLQIIFGIFVVLGILDCNFFQNIFWFIAYFIILIPISIISYKFYEKKLQFKIRSYF